MSEFVMREEDFHLGLIEKPSVPQSGSCFILYRSGFGRESSFVIENGMRLQSAEIRRGRYDRRATLSLAGKSIRHTQKILMKRCEFFFDVAIDLQYQIKNARDYYFGNRLESGEEVKQLIRKILKRCDEEWEIKQGPKLEIYIEEQLERTLSQYDGILFKVSEVTVSPDADAEKIIQSDKNKAVVQYLSVNDADEKINQYAQEARILEGKTPLENLRLEKFATMVRNFGALGPIVNEYLEGEKNGEELYNYIINNKLNELNMLNQAMEKDLLSQEDAFSKVKDLISDGGLSQKGSALLEEKHDAVTEEPVEKNSIKDGEFL